MNRRQLFARTVGALAAAAVAPVAAKMPKQHAFYEYAGPRYWEAARYRPNYHYGVVRMYDHGLISSQSFQEAFHRETAALLHEYRASLSGDEAVI